MSLKHNAEHVLCTELNNLGHNETTPSTHQNDPLRPSSDQLILLHLQSIG
jgi:hypothetical protein